MVFVSYLASLYGPLYSMFHTWGLAQGSRVGVERVFEVLDARARRCPTAAANSLPTGARGEVEWEDVSFGYVPGRRVLTA